MVSKAREDRQHGTSKQGDQRRPFQIDRDRLLYSTAFRRLAQVTQVVGANEGRLFHNRLTHSLKVAQVARRTAEKIIDEASPDLLDKLGGLDPDVVEAAALAHDLGHPPFGHIAEESLNEVAKEAGLADGFEGNAQTFRILTLLEPNRPQYYGMDLTRATLNATLKYPWLCAVDKDPKKDKKARKYSVYKLDQSAFDFARELFPEEGEKLALEASVMEFADDVTYSVHDLEDFYLAGLIPLDILTSNRDEFNKFFDEWSAKLSDPNIRELANSKNTKLSLRKLLESLFSSEHSAGSFEQVAHTRQATSVLIQRYIQSATLQECYGKYGYLNRSTKCELELKFLQSIVRKFVILNPRLATQQAGQRKIIRQLFLIYKDIVERKEVNLIPTRFLREGSLDKLLEEGDDKAQKLRVAVDIVASFSEPEAVLMYRRLTGIDQGSVMDYIV
jgi:dGTPase